MSIEKLAIYNKYAKKKFAKNFSGYFINFKTMPATRKKGMVLEFGFAKCKLCSTEIVH